MPRSLFCVTLHCAFVYNDGALQLQNDEFARLQSRTLFEEMSISPYNPGTIGTPAGTIAYDGFVRAFDIG